MEQDKKQDRTFSAKFFKTFLMGELSVIILGATLYYTFITYTGHLLFQGLMPAFIIVLALLKVIYFLHHTFRSVPQNQVNSFYRMLFSFGFIIFIIILSFALDYTCLSDCRVDSFSGVSHDGGFFHRLSEFLYFSVVTFATIGYGDISPVTMSAKFLVVLEISFSFIMVVFAMTNLRHSQQDKTTTT